MMAVGWDAVGWYGRTHMIYGCCGR